MRHSKTPQNRSANPNAPLQSTLTNPLCGDEISVYLECKDNIITQATFEGQCCALCTASASMLTTEIQDLDTTEITALANTLIDRLKTDAALPSAKSEDIKSLSGVAAFPSRKRCVTLPWEALLAALAQKSDD